MIVDDSENDMARDFGFDISMPDGNVGLPSAAHKLYMQECQMLYKEFMANMAIHMKTEKELKKALRKLHQEKMQNLRFSLYRSNSADPFARRADAESSIHGFLESRVNTPWGLDTIPDDEGSGGGGLRPQTAPAGTPGNRKGAGSQLDHRPKTAGVVGSAQDADDNLLDDVDSDSGLSEMSAATKSTVAGVVDRKLELSSGRKITVGQQSFSKITHGNVRAKLKHKEGRFIVKPVKINLELENSNSELKAYDPMKSKQQFDPASERLALVRRITSFKTPTISSDMKINNRVPIQKKLKGLDAKRMTVSEIYQNSRDRRTRHFRIVTNRPNKGMNAGDGHDGNDKSHSKQRWERAIREGLSRTSMSGGNMQRAGGGGGQENPSRPRSILLHSNSTASGGNKSLGDSLSAKDLADNAFMSMYQDVAKRPNSRVAFARADSQMSDHVFVNDVSLDASINCVYNHNRQTMLHSQGNAPGSLHSPSTPGAASVTDHSPNGTDGSKLFLRVPASRIRTESFNSNESEIRSRSDSINRKDRTQKINGNDRAHGPEMTPGNVRNFADRPASMISSDANAGQVPRLKGSLTARSERGHDSATPGNGTDRRKSAQPAKLDSQRDTVKIVKQQMRMDRMLDERMAVWRRRMAVKSSAMTTKVRPSPRRMNSKQSLR